MGLPRELRLRHRTDFIRVAEKGKGRANNLVVLRFAPNDLSTSRSGFSVSKRLGSAVRRNRVKRLLREAVRKVSPTAGYDMVFIARPESAGADYLRIESAVTDVLQRAGLLANKNDHPGTIGSGGGEREDEIHRPRASTRL